MFSHQWLMQTGIFVFSIRLWNVPVPTLEESGNSTKKTVEVGYCAGVFFFFFVKFSLGILTHSFLTCFFFSSQRVFMFGRMHFGKFWSGYSRKILKRLIWIYFLCLQNTSLLSSIFRSADHQWDGELFATAGAQLDIWNHNRFWY